MSQYFRKLKAKWKDPRCISLGRGKITMALDVAGLAAARPLAVSSFSAHVENCKCRTERREARQRFRRLLDLYGPNCVRQIAAGRSANRATTISSGAFVRFIL